MPRTAAILTLLLCLLAPRAHAQCECPAEDAVLIGHRGAGSNGSGADAPENTIESAQAAFAAGAEMVEIDVQLTADGTLVLMHDDTVDRTTDGTGCVSELTLDAIRALDADGAAVPTLDELLAGVTGGVNIEVKVPEGACPEQDLDATADAVVASIRAGAGSRSILVSSFDIEVLRRIRASDPSIAIGFLTAGASGIVMAQAEGFEAVNLVDATTNARTVEQAHARGLAINVWTVNGAEDIERMLALGVDGVISDTMADAVLARAAVCDAWSCSDAGAGPVDAGAPTVDAGPAEGSSGGCGVSARGASPGWLVAFAVAALCLRRRLSGADTAA